MSHPIPQEVEEGAREIESQLVHRLQTLTISTKGQTEEYRKGLRDMRHLVMENTTEIARQALLSVYNSGEANLVRKLQAGKCTVTSEGLVCLSDAVSAPSSEDNA